MGSEGYNISSEDYINTKNNFILRSESSNDYEFNAVEEKNYNKHPLTQIRKLQVRSKKLPPLCPFYNKKGELLPDVVSTSKALLTNYESDSIFNLTNINNGSNVPNVSIDSTSGQYY